jgi:FkbM family methyltransferase
MSIKSFIKRKFDYIKFKLNYPSIPVLHWTENSKMYSQHGQDLYLAGLLFGRFKSEPGVVLDIGCNHPVKFSNSLFFERHMGCKIIAIDALEDYQNLWAEVRPNAEFIATALAESPGEVTLFIPERSHQIDDMFSSINSINPKIKDSKYISKKVKSTTVDKVLTDRGINHILFASIDVEGAEMEVLKGIDFEKVKISAIIIENNNTSQYGSNEIRDYLENKDYVFYSRIGFLDDVFVKEDSFIKTKGGVEQ